MRFWGEEAGACQHYLRYLKLKASKYIILDTYTTCQMIFPEFRQSQGIIVKLLNW